MISILHPSRQRPLQALITAKNWLGKSVTQVEYILSLDIDDKQLSLYKDSFSGMNIKTIVNRNRSAVDAINKAAEVSTGNILIVVSDDFDCPQRWDEQIINRTEGVTDWIAKTIDGIQDWIITMPIMDRAYYNRFGYIYYPEYLHMFVDTELSCVADMLGKRIDLRLNFQHNHYSKTRAPKDEISKRADDTWGQGERLFLHRFKNNFDLLGELKPVSSSIHLNWIKSKIK